MRLFKSITSTEQIAIAFKPTGMTCMLLQTHHGKPPVHIKSHSHLPFTDMQLDRAMFNFSIVGTHIETFFQQNNMSDCPVRISLQGPMVVEKICTTHELQQKTSEQEKEQLHNMIWQETLIAKRDDKSTLYLCGITRHALFQYQLMAIKHNMNLQCVSTATLGLLSACDALNNNDTLFSCEKVFDIEKTMNLQSIKPIAPDIMQEQDCLVTKELIGLTLAGY